MPHGIIYGWLIVGCVFLLGAYLSFQNYRVFYLGYIGKEHASPLPLLGGLFCHLAMRVAHIAGVRPWAWLPWILDPGCVFLVGLFIYIAFASKGFSRMPPQR